MNVSQMIDGPSTFMSVSIFEALIEALREHPEGLGALQHHGGLRDAPITLKIGVVEIPIETVLEKCNEAAVRSFDSEVAERVKEMVFSSRLEAVKKQIDEACDKLDSYARDLNYDVGRMIEVELGPNSNWSESSGSCCNRSSPESAACSMSGTMRRDFAGAKFVAASTRTTSATTLATAAGKTSSKAMRKNIGFRLSQIAKTFEVRVYLLHSSLKPFWSL